MTASTPGVTVAAYPMVEEQDAAGRVAAVYAQVLDRMPMVPSLFKSLATCPPYLVLAWRQARGVLDDGQASDAGGRLAALAEDVTPPPGDDRAREELARFVGPLGRMLVVTSGLRLALDGDVDAPPADAAIEPGGVVPSPERDVPPLAELSDPDVLGAIRSQLATPIVNSLWRHLAGMGLLDVAWAHLTDHAAGAVRAADELAGHSRSLASKLRWGTAASPDAMAIAGCADAASGMRAVLDAYLLTLPRVLALVAGCRV